MDDTATVRAVLAEIGKDQAVQRQTSEHETQSIRSVVEAAKGPGHAAAKAEIASVVGE